MGGTVYKNGRVVLILDIITIVTSFRNKKFNASVNTGDNGENGNNISSANNISSKSQADINIVNNIINNLPNDTSRVLVVEDSATIRHAIDSYLDRDSYSLIMATDGLDALNKVKLFTPDLILLDISMPKMNGLEFLKIVRQIDEFKHTPVIVMTSREEQAFRDLAMQLDVDVYLKKPYDKSKLINAIDYVLD